MAQGVHPTLRSVRELQISLAMLERLSGLFWSCSGRTVRTESMPRAQKNEGKPAFTKLPAVQSHTEIVFSPKKTTP